MMYPNDRNPFGSSQDEFLEVEFFEQLADLLVHELFGDRHFRAVVHVRSLHGGQEGLKDTGGT